MDANFCDALSLTHSFSNTILECLGQAHARREGYVLIDFQPRDWVRAGEGQSDLPLLPPSSEPSASVCRAGRGRSRAGLHAPKSPSGGGEVT